MSQASTRSANRSDDWSKGLSSGLPKNFDFSVIGTIGDIDRLFAVLPNRDRGGAAKLIYEKQKLLGTTIVRSALMRAWEHDHEMVRVAFPGDREFVRALRSVSPPSKRKRKVRIWRGVNQVEGALGASWTTDRDLACWFAMRYFEHNQTAFLFTCLVPPDQIVIEYNGRSEHEVIPDLEALVDRVFLDTGKSKLKITPVDILSQKRRTPFCCCGLAQGLQPHEGKKTDGTSGNADSHS